MNDYTYTDFLIKKSVQPHSLRNNHGAVNQNQNLTLHLSKKAAQLRQDEGKDMNTMKIIESKKLQVVTIPDTDRYLKQITHPKELKWRELLKDDEHKRMMQFMSQNKYQDDCIVVSEGTKITHKNLTVQQKQLEKLQKQKKIWTIENKLKFIMADRVDFQEIMKMNKAFLTEKIKRNFWNLRQKQNLESTPQSSYIDAIEIPKLDLYIHLDQKSSQNSQSISPKKNINPINERLKNSPSITEQLRKKNRSAEGSLNNSQFSTSIVGFFDNNNENNNKTKRDQKIQGKDNENRQGSIKLHFSENLKQKNIVNLQSNNISQSASQNRSTEIRSDEMKQGQNQNEISLNERQIKKLEQIASSGISKQQQQFPIHPHFKQDNIDNNYDQKINNFESNINDSIIVLQECYQQAESKLSFGYHEGGGVPTMMNINPFDSEIFIEDQELETERKWRNVKPGENYEQLRSIDEEKEKVLIDFVCKKNQFQLIDLFPQDQRTKKYRNLKREEIQLVDFDMETYQKQQNQKQQQQQQQKKGESKSEVSSPLIDKPCKQIPKLQLPIPQDSIIENKNNHGKQKQCQTERLSMNQIKKKQKKCFLRLSKNSDINSIDYLKKYGLQDTINLNDEYRKFRQNTAVTSSTMKSQNHQHSFSLNIDNQNQFRSTFQSSNINDPYQMNINQNSQKINTNYDTSRFNYTLASTNRSDKITENIKDNKILNVFNIQQTSKNQSHDKPINHSKKQISKSGNLPHLQDLQSNFLLNFMQSPIKSVNNQTDNLFSERKLKQHQPYLSQQSEQLKPINNNIDNKLLSNKVKYQSKSAQRMSENQNYVKEKIKLKEDFIDFYDNIITTSKKQVSQSNNINRKINKMMRKVDKSLSSMQYHEGPKLSSLSHEFREFKDMKVFKRKLFNFTVNKIHPDDRKSLFDSYSMTHNKEVEEIFSHQIQK